MPGVLIAIDGIDGAGKTTLARLLADALPSSFECVLSKEPTEGPWGMQLRQSANSGRHDAERELYLLTEDRKQHVRELIAPALARGAIVILDRYVYSTAAYQSNTVAEAERILEDQFAFAPVPDLAMIIDTPVPDALGRIKARGDIANHFERADTLEACRAVFLGPVKARAEVRVIDGSKDPETVFMFARMHLFETMKRRAQAEHGPDDIAVATALMPLFAAM